ncbi:MAG: proliferating cell nuclear antigen (pcna) [Candidatus Diapherotrites archaeon]|nr:proliferating cell nuclear antigen (pcna) [Candidatus Diapherotrites archaeon]
MKVVLEKASDFQKCIEAIAVLIDEAEFLFDENRLSLKATDPSQISMVDFSLNKKAFKEYNVKEKTKIGVDLSYFSQVLHRAKASDSLTLELEEGANRLNVTFEGDSKRKFQIPLIDISSAELPNPKIDFDAEMKIKASLLQDALKDAALISTHVSLGANSDTFAVKANSSKGNLNNETKKDGKTLVEMKSTAGAQSMFPLDYLQDMLKAPASDSEVTVKLKSNAPVEINYSIGEAQINYFLAPRIESD